ncbi:matrix metalloproteinase-19-like [Asterias rubens]|uniref:matrix metalloproteinase-19-like n=1 Tax=Asterias rubens TaxID=7604 RepID=UPI0014553AD0|nr:matrix metalloproteinase-19-like [Asterias rubens]
MDRLMATMGHFGKMTKELINDLRLLLFISCVLYMINTTEATASSLLTYLQKYEYFGPDIGDQVHDDTQLEKAIRALQYQCNLNVTGIEDEHIFECISRSRCGNTDKVLPLTHRKKGGRRKRYYIPSEGLDWSAPSTLITYDIIRYTDDLPPTVVEEAIRDAFELWSNSTILTFQRIRGGDVDIGIYFYPSFEEHGDNRPFDGPGMVLAHAFWPWSEEDTADVHLDEGETWTHKSYSGANLWLVAAHEIGHSLGLGHSVAFGSLMFPFHFGYNPTYTLHQDDIDGIQSLYGDVDASEPEDAPDLCQVTMDAVMMDGHTYIFKGDYYWRVSNGQQENGYPQRISSRWTGLEGDIDAAITVKNSFVWGDQVQKTFFFKGRLVWRYTLTNLDVGFPKDISEVFSGFPADVARVKGVFEISGNGETYFFSDNGFYLLNWQGVQGPFGINVFAGIPTNIVSAMQWTDNYIYFFTDNFLYFQSSPWSFTTSRGYPRYAHIDWLGCSE